MIVIGPQVLSHRLLEGDDDDDGGDNRKLYHDDAIDQSDIERNDINGIEKNLAKNNININDAQHDVQKFEKNKIHRWRDARLKVSMALGSVGANPLDSSPFGGKSNRTITCHCENFDVTTGAAEQHDKMDDVDSSSQFQTNLDCISDMATAHVNLLETMDHMLETLRVGASVRLGLGPNVGGIGNGRLVARAENAWIARLRQSHDKPNVNALQISQPRLTLHKLRSILHHAILDQATSLQGVLKSIRNHGQCQEMNNTTEWEEFTADLQHSVQLPHTWTLSQFSLWVKQLSGLLSYVLSNILCEKSVRLLLLPINGSMIGWIMHSSQFARERTAFLNAACCPSQSYQNGPNKSDMSDASTTSSADPDNFCDHNNEAGSNLTNELNDTQSTRQMKRQAQTIIQNLQSMLEASRISLWAFEQSYSNQSQHSVGNSTNDCTQQEDIDSAGVWWFKFKDLMERSCASMSEFENRFLSIASPENADEDASMSQDVNDLVKVDDSIAESSEHVSNATGMDDENLLATCDEESNNQFAGKTLVFSGSGTKASQPLRKHTSPVSSEEKEGSAPQTFNMADQMMLLRDLESRIKTMGLAEEHQVVNMDTCFENSNGVARSSCRSSNRGRGNQPFFLGVSGSVLAELSSAIGNGITRHAEDEECST